MKLIIVVAKSDNNAIGKNGELPWHLPADLAFFERQIEGCYLLSGRRSYESEQGKDIFKGRDFVVLTRRAGYKARGGKVAGTVAEGIEIARGDGARRLCILGGAEVYRQTIGLADELIVTEIHTRIDGDAFFPEINPSLWEETKREEHAKDGENPYDYAFVWYGRVKERGGTSYQEASTHA
ncbi:MAG: dihydrofolate reductase [Phaeodactylibacter sp.]|nr:dihydrofolate reductase [Phaeodactylibacter sp.]MCB9274052.1 dihydrofolate reductase [Lewinellaceae bacterium]